jgi:hypothetical protein
MATVLKQSAHGFEDNTLPIWEDRRNRVNFALWAIERILRKSRWARLSDMIDVLYRELSTINGLTLSKPDANGNITVTIGDEIRLALALGLTNTQTNKILLFGRQEW